MITLVVGEYIYQTESIEDIKQIIDAIYEGEKTEDNRVKQHIKDSKTVKDLLSN